MNSPDNDLISILVHSSMLLESEVPVLSTWWTDQSRGGESLVAFLHREGVLRDGVPRMLELSRKGYVRIDSASTIVQNEGLNRLREALNRGARKEPELLTIPEVTVVSGAVEVHEPVTSSAVPVLETHEPISGPTPIFDRTQPTVTEKKGQPSPNGSKIGELLGKCLLTDEIGRGGCGIVYRALHISLKIPVAVKMLLTSNADPAVIEGFRAEALTLARLNHQNVVRVLDIENGEVPYFVLEFIEGLSLRDLIRQSGRLQVDRAIAIMLQAASGLAAASALGIVHRDVSPANILLMRDGTAKMTDFGLAAFMADLQSSPDLEARGTAAYMSPEQARGDSLDSRSDIYSLGATFYHAVTGNPPFPGGTRNQVLLRHAMETPTSPNALIPEIDPAVSRLILKMLAKSPDDRFHDFEALITALKAIPPATRNALDSGDSSGLSGEAVGAGAGRKSSWFSKIAGYGRDRSIASS